MRGATDDVGCVRGVGAVRLVAGVLGLSVLAALGAGPSAARSEAALPGCLGGPTIACYPLNQPTGIDRYRMRESINPAANSVADAINPTTTSGVAASRGDTTYHVDGWGAFVRQVGTRWQLAPDAAGRVTFGETFGQVLVDRTGIQDPATSFNPGLRDWRVKVRLEPQLLSFSPGVDELPDPCPDSRCVAMQHPSYNVVQKGRNDPAGPPGGFYKIEIMGYAGSDHGLGFTKGSVHCSFIDDDGTSVEAFSGGGGSPVLMDHKGYYTVDCLRQGSRLTLKVTNHTTGAVQRKSGTMTDRGRGSGGGTSGDGVLDAVAPSNLAGSQYSPLLSIGKKPLSANPGDAFRGWIDYVSLSNG